MQWHGRLGLPPASNQAFGEYLERELQVTPDAAPFSGESHWWTPEILSPVLGGSAATAAARPQDAPRAPLGTRRGPSTRILVAPTAAALCRALPPEFRRPRRGRRGRTTRITPRKVPSLYSTATRFPTISRSVENGPLKISPGLSRSEWSVVLLCQYGTPFALKTTHVSSFCRRCLPESH